MGGGLTCLDNTHTLCSTDTSRLKKVFAMKPVLTEDNKEHLSSQCNLWQLKCLGSKAKNRGAVGNYDSTENLFWNTISYLLK